MDMGLGRHPADRSDVLPKLWPVDLSAWLERPRQRSVRGCVAAVFVRPRRPQLFRYTRHLLLRIFRSGCAVSDSGHPSGDGLHLRVRPADPGRRTQLSDQLHESEPRQRRFQSDLVHCVPEQHLHSRKCRPGRRQQLELLAARCSWPIEPISGEVTWKRSITDPYGQVWMPFVKMRADAAAVSIVNQPGVANFMTPGDNTVLRAMPTVGLEYRYPFISIHAWGTQTIEPIAQVIVRPNETSIGKLPNEDSQSLIFDDSNLFKIDKFAGWDRVEGGGRANVGFQYTTQFNRGGSIGAAFGQSYQLFGTNSFAVGD